MKPLCLADTTRIGRKKALVAAFLAAASLPSESLRAQTCAAPGDRSPGVPVPECVNSTGATLTPCPTTCTPPACNRLWRTTGLHPATPGQTLPPDRDSTQYIGKTKPGFKSGHELFLSLDIVTVNGVGERLYLAYNSGFSVWGISTNPANPNRLKVADGWEGHFLVFPLVSEKLTFIDDISVLYDSATNKDVVAVSAVNPVGPSLWEYSVGPGTYRQLYQDPGTRTRQIRLVEVKLLGGAKTHFAFAATDNGVAVYNATAARLLASPCEDDKGSNPLCGGVYRGLMPTTNGRIHVDAMVPASKLDRVFVATGNGGSRAPELWEVLNPVTPSVEGPGAQLRWAAGSDLNGARGFELFAYQNKHYLALVHQKNVKIFDIGGCLNLSGLSQCTPTLRVTLPVRPDVFSAEEYLTFSTAGGKAYLYYGIGLTGLSGSDVDQLFDISDIGDSSPTILRLPQEGSYLDPCNGQPIKYWGHTLPRNFQGLNEFQPRKGQFAPSGYFYRAGTSVFDVHVDGGGSGPPPSSTITTGITDPASPPYWMSDQISFAATATGGCEPSSSDWVWTATPQGLSDVLPVLIAQPSNFGFYEFDCISAGGARCDPTTFDVKASNAASSCTTATLVPATLTLKDPKIEITSVNPPDGTDFEECQTLPLSAQLAGRGPVSWKWTVNGAAVPSCDGTNQGGGQDVSALPVNCEVAILEYHTDIFSDGFESGGTGSWTVVKSGLLEAQVNSPAPAAVTPGNLPAKGLALGAVLRVWNGADTGVAPWDVAEITVDVNPSGVPAFIDPPTETISGVSANLTYPASSTTTWLWEFEDPDNGNAICTFPASHPCVSEETSTDSVTHVWGREGTFKYRVRISNCGPDTDFRDGDVEVIDVDPPVVTSFDIAAASIIIPTNPATAGRPCRFECVLCMPQEVTCKPGQAVQFTVTTDIAATGYRFDWDGLGSGASFGAITTSLSHSFASTPAGPFQPAAKAVIGTVESVTPLELTKKVTIGNF